MANTTKSGCFGCRHAEWDADGATCALTGLLVGNYGHGCQKRVAETQPDSTWTVPGRPKSEQADLKPCPFCGKNKAKIDYPYFPDTYCWVRCYECYCATPPFKTPEEAVEAWNRRASETAMKIDDGLEMTNADRIRHMTDEELIELVNSSVCHYVTDCLDNDCEECGRKWVMSEVHKDANDN